MSKGYGSGRNSAKRRQGKNKSRRRDGRGGQLMAFPKISLAILSLALGVGARAFAKDEVPAGGRLVNFTAGADARKLAKQTAEELKALLDEVGYDAATKEL